MIFLIMSACFDQSSGQPRVNPGKQEGGGREKNKQIGEFYFRGILQPTTGEPEFSLPSPSQEIHSFQGLCERAYVLNRY